MAIEKKEIWLIYILPYESGNRRIIGSAPTKAEAERMGHYLNGEGSWDATTVEGPHPIYYGATEDAVKAASVERARIDAEIKMTEAKLQALKSARV